MLPGGSILFVAPVVVGRVVARCTEKSPLRGQRFRVGELLFERRQLGEILRGPRDVVAVSLYTSDAADE